MDPFSDKACVVTGGGSGMGKALSELLLELGATVYAIDISAERPDSLDCGADPTRLHGPPMDITDEEALSNLLSVVVQHNGSIDYLFNAAGITIAQANVVRFQGHAGHSPSGINQPNCKPCLSYYAAR